MSFYQTRGYKPSFRIHHGVHIILCMSQLAVSTDFADDTVFNIHGGVMELQVFSLRCAAMGEAAHRCLQAADIFN